MILVTGGAGFIGSNLVERLLADGEDVVIFDNFSSGRRAFIEGLSEEGPSRVRVVEGDLLDTRAIEHLFEEFEIDFVYHLAANPEVRIGVDDPGVHLEQNVITTYNLLEGMRRHGIREIAFTSTSTVYGEAALIPTPEEYGPLIPISTYGASKLASEALITSYTHTFDMRAWIFRFANVVGKRGTHGVIFDFIRKLRANPRELEILGDGRQEKSYMLVDDCIDGMLFAIRKARDPVNIFNLGSKDTINVTRIAEIVVEQMDLKNVTFRYTGGARGWKGDVPRMMLAIDAIRNLGWEPRFSSEESVRAATRYLLGSE
ncbi:MAG TPA: NAD-dependent epimerase/dehydratase family protein [Candidatus Syntrophoarchaeum butanivorans]|uniref:NAD-dependent epimerase/dehydratase family protein n=1 Tax=Candidatus Syntropharchaeum butanivorans TaxID=1839936 RepID=A0A7C1B6B1_9EURY|nr:NAD-dependent epimerase/dehydratase family protein [Candidatus Syntrophoarchaeum butanivorans]